MFNRMFLLVPTYIGTTVCSTNYCRTVCDTLIRSRLSQNLASPNPLNFHGLPKVSVSKKWKKCGFHRVILWRTSQETPEIEVWMMHPGGHTSKQFDTHPAGLIWSGWLDLVSIFSYQINIEKPGYRRYQN